MLVVLLASGLALIALPRLAHRWGRRLHPAEWARLCFVATGGGAAVIEVAAVLYAAPTVARASGNPVLAKLCERMLGPLAPGGSALGWTAAAVAIGLPALGAVGWVRARRTTRAFRIERGLGSHAPYDEHELVVLPSRQLAALSVPALSGVARDQIVVSDGLLETLSAAEVHAVVQHEAAHLRHAHHRYLTLASAVDHAFPWFPLARRSTATLRLALERWADEDAAVAAADRGAVRDALLVVTTSLAAEPQVAAFSAAETIGERLDALEADAPRPSRARQVLLYSPGTLLGALVLVGLSSWASEVSGVLAMTGTCTS